MLVTSLSSLISVVIVVLGAVASLSMLFSLGGNDTSNFLGVATDCGALFVTLNLSLAACNSLVGSWLAGSRVATNVTSHVAAMLEENPGEISVGWTFWPVDGIWKGRRAISHNVTVFD